MARGRSRTVLVTRWSPDGARRAPDELVVEEPLTVRLDGHLVATTMRTPGHDYELAAGFCFTEGLLDGAVVTGVRYCATGPAVETAFNVVTVETGGRAPEPASRLTRTTSSCGICGTAELDELDARLDPLPASVLASFPIATLVAAAERATLDQPLFASTGAVHAAVAVGTDGQVVVGREDVGRHNAVDKVIGRLLLDGALPAHQLALLVTSRASFEIVQKAWAAGFAAVAAVSAPTTLAVEAARRAGLTLVGFVRDGRANVY
jgi:FdhD protein